MGKLTTHVLDTAHGCPAAGMRVALFRLDAAGAATELKSFALDADGRAAGGRCSKARLWFAAAIASCSRWARILRRVRAVLADPPFLDDVPLDFGIAAVDQHYHVPLLVSPWSYSTYRGS